MLIYYKVYVKVNATYKVWLYQVLYFHTNLMANKHQNLVKLGKNIRIARKAKGFSQEAFAAEVGMGRTYMGRVERGEQNISIQNLIEIALTLKMEVGELVPKLRTLKSQCS